MRLGKGRISELLESLDRAVEEELVAVIVEDVEAVGLDRFIRALIEEAGLDAIARALARAETMGGEGT